MRALNEIEHFAADADRLFACSVVNRHHLGVGAIDGEDIFLMADKAEDLRGQRRIIVKELKKNGRTHQYCGIGVNAFVG